MGFSDVDNTDQGFCQFVDRHDEVAAIKEVNDKYVKWREEFALNLAERCSRDEDAKAQGVAKMVASMRKLGYSEDDIKAIIEDVESGGEQ